MATSLYDLFGDKSLYHSLTWKKAKQKRTIVITPGYVSLFQNPRFLRVQKAPKPRAEYVKTSPAVAMAMQAILSAMLSALGQSSPAHDHETEKLGQK
jgi:hypothetical protein